MPHKALALKWRPQTLAQLIGQSAIQTALSHALKSGRVHPACLFSGPRGTGKTSLARIVAKTIRCAEKKDPLSPCLKCEECRLIQKSQSLDVLEIDGASANGVEAIRDLKSALSHMPSSGSKKIYIIDEVHMLSTGAFNALLKTLEEPPAHALFIMATTEAQKIPLTVISRCQKFDFRLIPPPLIKKRLEEIAQSEGVEAEQKALWLIAREAHGSLRDSQSLLDRMISALNGEKITFEKTAALLCQTPPALLARALKALCERNEKAAAEILYDLRSAGAPPRIFLESLVEGLRDLIALKLNPQNQPPLVSRSAEEIEEMKAFSSPVGYEDLHFLFSIALEGERDLNFCHDSMLALEVLLLKLAAAPKLEALSPAHPFIEPEEGPSSHLSPPASSGPSKAQAPKPPNPPQHTKDAKDIKAPALSKAGSSNPSKASAAAGAKSHEAAPLQAPQNERLKEKGLASRPPQPPAEEKESKASLAAKPLKKKPESSAERKEGETEEKAPAQGASIHETLNQQAAAEASRPSLLNDTQKKESGGPLSDNLSGHLSNNGQNREIEGLWLKILSALEKKSPLLAGIVENLRLKGKEGEDFVFFEPTDPFMKAKAEKNLKTLIKELNEFLGENSGASIHFQKKSPEQKEALPLKSLKREREMSLLMQSARQDPAAKKMQQLFKTDIFKVGKEEKGWQ